MNYILSLSLYLFRGFCRFCYLLSLGCLFFTTTELKADEWQAGYLVADRDAPRIISGPSLVLNPSGHTPLAAQLDLRTNEDSSLVVELDDGARRWTIGEQTSFAKDHSLALIGMRADRIHDLRLVIKDRAGNITKPEPLRIKTPELPADFPLLKITKSLPAKMEPGLTVLIARRNFWNGSYILILNRHGDVVWYYDNARSDHPILSTAKLSSRGTILAYSDTKNAFELDFLGNTISRWFAAGLGSDDAPAGAAHVLTDSFHHEFYELPQGNDADYIALSTELREFEDYPIDPTDLSLTTPLAEVIGDVITEFKADGTVVREMKLFDILDPYRLSYDSNLGFYDGLYQSSTYDWSHGNAVIIDPNDPDFYVISLRHQEAVVKVNRYTEEIKWILGTHAGWGPAWQDKLLTPVGANFEWSYHHHAPAFTTEGSLVLFDNGNGRAFPPDQLLDQEQRYSRAVEYMINEEEMTVSQIWAYGGPGQIWYSRALGDADPLPHTGNVLVTDGMKISDLHGKDYARVFEVTRTSPAEIVFELLVDDPAGIDGWTIYRADRITLPGVNLEDSELLLELENQENSEFDLLQSQPIGDLKTEAIFRVRGGFPNQEVYLFVTEVNGEPVELKGIPFSFDESGTLRLPMRFGSTFWGKQVKMLALGYGAPGVVSVSNELLFDVPAMQ